MEYYSAIKNEILLFVTSYMNLKESNLSEISHMEKDKYHVIIPLCGSKTIANKSNTHWYREQTSGYQRWKELGSTK